MSDIHNIIKTEIVKLTELKHELDYMINSEYRSIVLDNVMINYIINQRVKVEETIYRLGVLLIRNDLSTNLTIGKYINDLQNYTRENAIYIQNLYDLF